MILPFLQVHIQNCQQYSRQIPVTIYTVTLFQWKYPFWCNPRIVFLFFLALYSVILHKKISVIDWSFTSSDISKRCIYFLAYVFRNMNSMYYYIIKYLYITFTLYNTYINSGWHPLSISWLIFLWSAQLDFPSTVLYRAFSFLGKSLSSISFPNHHPSLEWPIPLRRTLRHKNECILAIQRDHLKFESFPIFTLLYEKIVFFSEISLSGWLSCTHCSHSPL